MAQDQTADGFGSFTTLRTQLFLGIMLFVFSSELISELGKVLKNRPVTATITERIQSCHTVVRNADRSRTRTKMPCDEAFALRRADTSRKTRAYKTTYVVLSFPLRNGSQHLARVKQRDVKARKKAVGDQIDIAYSKRNPNKVTRPKSWRSVFVNAVLVVGSFIALMLSLFGRTATTQFSRTLAERLNQGTRAKNATPSRKTPGSRTAAKTDQNTYQDALAHLDKIVDGSGWRDTVRGGSKKPKPATQKRHHKKPAPIPVTGGVVSKRRGLFGLFG